MKEQDITATPSAAILPPEATITVQGFLGEVRLNQCLRCGSLWMERERGTVKCPSCRSALWNTPRVYQREGAPPPTQGAKPRGRAFQTGHDSRRVEKQTHKNADAK